MSSTPPTPDNGYLIPLDQWADRDFFQGVFTSIDDRLRGVEGQSADYDEAINLIVTQALQTVSATITAEITNQRAILEEIQRQAEEVLDEYQSRSIPGSRVLLDAIPGLAEATTQGAIAAIVRDYARLDGARFTGEVEVRNVGNGLRHHLPGIYQGVWRLQNDGRLVWFIGEATPALTIFPDGNLYLHGAGVGLLEQIDKRAKDFSDGAKTYADGIVAAMRDSLVNGAGSALDTLRELADALGNNPNFSATISEALAKRLRFDTPQTLTGSDQAQGLANLGFSGFMRDIRGAANSADLRTAIDTDRTRQAFHISGGDETNGLDSNVTVRLSTTFVARSSTALIEGSCSVRSNTDQIRFCYLQLRLADLGVGGFAGGTPEQVVSMTSPAVDRFYSLSRSLAVSNLVVGRTYRAELCPRVDVVNSGRPQGMLISGVN